MSSHKTIPNIKQLIKEAYRHKKWGSYQYVADYINSKTGISISRQGVGYHIKKHNLRPNI